MILSVSRRTDIPAFYTDWFFNRLEEGYVLVRNPMNYYQVSKIQLTPNLIDCIVFWTKDPTNMLHRLNELKNYRYYFQITITGYDNTIERNVRAKEEVIEAFKTLSQTLGKNRVIWRYDPIIISPSIDLEFHKKNFTELVTTLSGYTERCIISFVDMYSKTERNMKHVEAKTIMAEDMRAIGKELSAIGSTHGLNIETCSEQVDLSSVGIEHAKCIDDRLISEIIGHKLNIDKDKNQRDICGCVSSIDIGAYNTCQHGCSYCYANFSEVAVKNNITNHNINSPFLIGHSEPDDKITDRKMQSYIDPQVSILDLI